MWIIILALLTQQIILRLFWNLHSAMIGAHTSPKVWGYQRLLEWSKLLYQSSLLFFPFLLLLPLVLRLLLPFHSTAVVGPVIGTAVVLTFIPLIFATILAYCITGYIRDVLFHSVVKSCIGSSCNIWVSRQYSGTGTKLTPHVWVQSWQLMFDQLMQEIL